jgi:hypothetical protein
VPPTDSASGLNGSRGDTQVRIATPVNENNVYAFLDPGVFSAPNAGAGAEHKVWLFWNSTRNGTADLYYETINPRFSAGP